VGPLPESRDPITKASHDAILVIVDRLTKYAYFVPVRTTTTAEELAHVLLKGVVARYGLPEEIISDRDKLFTSRFWNTLLAKLGTKAKLSTSFHPQTDGQTERMNQTLEQYLRCYVNYQQDDWVQMLPLAQFACNSADSASTKVYPFYANYGYQPEAYRTATSIERTSQDAKLRVTQLKALHAQLEADIACWRRWSLELAPSWCIYFNSKQRIFVVSLKHFAWLNLSTKHSHIPQLFLTTSSML
jgi:hypothetical protein